MGTPWYQEISMEYANVGIYLRGAMKPTRDASRIAPPKKGLSNAQGLAKCAKGTSRSLQPFWTSKGDSSKNGYVNILGFSQQISFRNPKAVFFARGTSCLLPFEAKKIEAIQRQ